MDRAALETQLRQIIASAEAALSELEKEKRPAAAAAPPPPAPEPAPDPPDQSGARLVAMKLALDGSSREDVAKHLADEYKIADSKSLLDDVFARV